jgi:zinc transport system ATP-binding protein
MEKIIQLKNLDFSYWKNSRKIFSSISTEIYKWDFIWIFGENWSGKTTLVKLLLGILKPINWEINWFLEGEKKVSKSEFNIEYISQKAQMIDSIIPITVKEIVKMWNKRKPWIINHFRENCSYETIEKALKHVHMIDFINSPFSTLSWWQKQRVLMAKALISNPDVIIMDEPTAWVDLVAQKHFYDLLSHLNEVHNITIVLISHDTKFVWEKIKKVWYVWSNNCQECENEKLHFFNIKKMFPNQKVEFFS